MSIRLWFWAVIGLCMGSGLCLGGDLDWFVKPKDQPMYVDDAALSVTLKNNSADSRTVWLGYEQLGIFSFDVLDSSGRLIATAASYNPGGVRAIKKRVEVTIAPNGEYEIILPLSYWDIHLEPDKYRIELCIEASLLRQDQKDPTGFIGTAIPKQTFKIPISISPGKANDIPGRVFEYIPPHPSPDNARD